MVTIVNDNYDCIQVFYARIYNMATIPIKECEFYFNGGTLSHQLQTFRQ